MGGGVEKSLKTWALILLLPENRGSLLAYPKDFHFSSILPFFCVLLPKNKGSSFFVDVPKNDGKIVSKFLFRRYTNMVFFFMEIYPKSKGCSHFLIALLNFETQ
jgi:hypothetical protein